MNFDSRLGSYQAHSQAGGTGTVPLTHAVQCPPSDPPIMYTKKKTSKLQGLTYRARLKLLVPLHLRYAIRDWFL